MNRREFTKLAALGSGFTMLGNSVNAQSCKSSPTQKRCCGSTSKKKPNLLYIFPDQYRLHAMGIWNEPGYDKALGCASDPVVTPAIDKLAKESVLFTQAVSIYPLCSPYRGMFLSGMYPENNGVRNNCRKDRPDSLRHDVSTLTDVLFDAGYETAYVGKTHWERNQNLFDENQNYIGLATKPGGLHFNDYDTYIPPGRGRHGNKYWYQCVKDVHKDPRVYSSDEARTGLKDGDQFRPEIYSPKLEADVIVDYLNNNDQQRDPDKPFSLIWAPNPPHNPYASEDDCDEVAYREHYKDKTKEELINRPNMKTKPRPEGPDSIPYYFANVTGVDKQIERVFQALEESGEADNTIVVFTSDHGELMGSQGHMGKNYIWEESMLVPFMIKQPGQLQHRLEDLMITPVDIMPTLLGLMGLEKDIPETVEGTNFAKEIKTADFSANPKHDTVPYIGPRRRGLRTNQYSLCIQDDGEVLLYDNKKDPYQMNNLNLDRLSSKTKHYLLSEMGRWLKLMNDPWYHKKTMGQYIQYPAA